jgi:hypothetical protein
MKQKPPNKQNVRFRVTMLVDEQHTLEKKLTASDRAEALRRSVRWATTQVGDFKQGQTLKITIVKIEQLGSAVSIRTFKTRPLAPGEALSAVDRIRIPKGTKYRSAHPQFQGVLEAKRTYITSTGTETRAGDDDVSWVGNGGYMCWTDREKVERVLD